MGRTAYDFEEYGIDNIRTYVRNFELPRPDPCSEKDLLFMLGRGPYIPSTDVNKSHQNILHTRHERWRSFENIQHLTLDGISPLKWTNMLPLKANEPIDKASCAIDPRYRLPQVLPDFYTHAPIDISNMQSWLNLLLITATRIMHTTMPATSPYAFQYGKNKSKDNHIFRHFVWSPNGLNPHEPTWDAGSVVVAYQPPFVLTLQDLQEFASCRAFPTFDAISDHLSSKYRLWAKIWDTCQVNHSNWFILTSYTHWVFGAFSKGMRVAFVSPVITYSRSKPSILEIFLYWVCSAMNQPGTFRLPQVGDDVLDPYEVPCTAYDVLFFGHRAVLALCDT
ncbi:hypothetical protein CPB83DRAFT_590328 [Crepidotus variabilis]|uniref:Uncharacterized protein n=1 Tax=Crepidotus variabilis TaxID=179855 RepID=A0A9P6JUK3_9AGAR|nr:hypothetical protein CPB83DRAFT_590328 [Crepidotus variabilis]